MLNSKKFLFLSGIGLATIFAPMYFIIFSFSFSIFLRSIILSLSVRDAFTKGYVFGLGFFIANFYWLVTAMSHFPSIPYILILILVFCAISIISCSTAILSLVVFKLRYYTKYIHILFVFFWILLEYCFEHIVFQFPWAFIGYGAGFSLVFSQSASLWGVLGISFILTYIGSIFYEFKLTPLLKTKIITAIILVLSIIFFGYFRVSQHKSEFLENRVRLVQPSIKQSEKWSEEFFSRNMNLLTALSTTHLPKKTDLVVWPESAITMLHNKIIVQKILNKLFSPNQDFLLISGGVTAKRNFQEKKNELYVSMFGINNKLQNIFIYHKSHLVPFGEYIPAWITKIVNFTKFTYGDISYSKGQPKNIFLHSLNLKFTPLICYEVIFSTEVASRVQDADFIINIANDAWYGNSTEPHQHFVMSIFRAIENSIPVLRVSNNGISGIIDPIGTVVHKTTLNDITYLDGKIPKALVNKTIFSIWGEKIVLLLIAVTLFLEFIIKRFL